MMFSVAANSTELKKLYAIIEGGDLPPGASIFPSPSLVEL